MPLLDHPDAKAFLLHWGEMGSRWGVNRTVAQIHALLYLSEPGRVRTTTHSSASGAVPVLVSSQLLSTLCFTLVAVLRQVCADRQRVGVVHAPAMLAFTTRYGIDQVF